MSEEIVYSSDGILITRTLAKFGDTSFPINGIGSVYIQRPSFWDWYKTIVVATLVSVGIWVLARANGWPLLEYAAYGSAALGLLGSFALPSKLMIRTASGDQQAFEDGDRAKLIALKEAVEKAVTLRG